MFLRPNILRSKRRAVQMAIAALTAVAVVTGGALPALAADVLTEEAKVEKDEPPSTYTGPFVDDEGSVHEDSIAALWAADLTRGCAEWKFCPRDEVTRAQMATFLVRALDVPTHKGETRFVDTDDSVHQGAIERLAGAAITAGCNPPANTRYCPGEPVSRAQMATFLARALELPAYSGPDIFEDDNDSVHENAIERLAKAGITAGCGDGRYCPDRAVTRAELATMLTRGLGLSVPSASQRPSIPADVIATYEAEITAWPEGPDPEGWRPLIEQYFKPGDVQRAIDVIACESNGYRYAANPGSSARGLFQHMGRFWDDRSTRAGVGGADIFDPVAQMTVAAWLVYEQGGWSAHWYPSQHCWG